MNVPLFVRVQDEFVNISLCQRAHVEGETLVFDYSDEHGIEIEYQTPVQANRAFEALQQILTSKNLFLGAVN